MYAEASRQPEGYDQYTKTWKTFLNQYYTVPSYQATVWFIRPSPESVKKLQASVHIEYSSGLDLLKRQAMHLDSFGLCMDKSCRQHSKKGDIDRPWLLFVQVVVNNYWCIDSVQLSKSKIFDVVQRCQANNPFSSKDCPQPGSSAADRIISFPIGGLAFVWLSG